MKDIHSSRATRALQKLAETDPAFGSLSLFCKHRDAKEDMKMAGAPLDENGKQYGAPAWTDGKICFYAPGYSAFTLKEQIGVAAHEILHVALRHVTRAKKLAKQHGREYSSFRFNVAADAIINETLVMSGYTLPKKCIMLTTLLFDVFGTRVDAMDCISDWNVEKLYNHLSNHSGSKASKSGGSWALGKSDGPGSKNGDPIDLTEEEFDELLRQWAEANGYTDDFFPEEGDSADDGAEDGKWQRRLAQALSHGSKAGYGIGKLGHRIGDLPKTRTPWENILRSAASRAMVRKPRMGYKKPTRRFLALDSYARQNGLRQPAYEPSFQKEAYAPKIAVGFDVSGSIHDRLKERLAAEVASLGRRTGAEIHLFIFDTIVLSHIKMEGTDYDAEIRKVELAQGGGTCFKDVMEKAAAINPSLILMLTDLEGPFGPNPNIPVLWAIPQEAPRVKPPFGQVMSLAY
jgi:hypothetical protein